MACIRYVTIFAYNVRCESIALSVLNKGMFINNLQTRTVTFHVRSSSWGTAPRAVSRRTVCYGREVFIKCFRWNVCACGKWKSDLKSKRGLQLFGRNVPLRSNGSGPSNRVRWNPRFKCLWRNCYGVCGSFDKHRHSYDSWVQNRTQAAWKRTKWNNAYFFFADWGIVLNLINIFYNRASVPKHTELWLFSILFGLVSLSKLFFNGEFVKRRFCFSHLCNDFDWHCHQLHIIQ